MKNFIVYLENGQIIKQGRCQDYDFYLQGENVIEGVANDSCQYISNGNIVDMPPKPNGCWDFDFLTKQWVQNFKEQSDNILSMRSSLLYQSDWTQLPNNPLTFAKQEEWAIYRQELRDVTNQPGYPFDVIWPTQPE